MRRLDLSARAARLVAPLAAARAAVPVATRIGPPAAAPVVALLAGVLVAGAAYASAWIALDLFKVPGAASAMWWPAAGVALVIVVRCPRRWWWWLLLAFAVANTAANRDLGPWAVTLSYSVVNVIEIGVAAMLLVGRGGGAGRRLQTPADAARFVTAFAAAIAVGSTVIALRALVVPAGAAIHDVVAGYAITHALGLLAIAPLLLPGRLQWRTGVGQDVEFALVIAVTVAADYWVFISPAQAGRAFPALLPVIWAAIRLSPWRATVVTLVTCGFTAYGTSRGVGTFAEIADLTERQLVTEMMIGTVTVTALALVLITRHRALLAAHLRDSEETLRIAIRDAMVGTYSMRLDSGHIGEISDVNMAFATMLGYRRDDLIGRSCKVFNPPPDAETDAGFDAWMERFARGDPESFRRETKFVSADGAELWVEVSTTRVQPTSAPPFALVHVHDLTDREQTKQLLERMALHDALTGLPNRTLLFDRLEQQLGLAERDGGSLALLYLDLDGFKPVNDEHGHGAGDAVLVEVARRLSGAVRSRDTVARLGGDEFAVLCPRVADDNDIDLIAARIRAAMREPIALPDGTTVTVTISVGCAVADAETDGGIGLRGMSADELVRRADVAMYTAKREATAARGLPHDEVAGTAS